MSETQSWAQRWARACAQGPGQRAEMLRQMIDAASVDALSAALNAPRDSAGVLAATLDAPRLRPFGLALRLLTAQARLMHRHAEDSIAANNTLAKRRGGDRVLIENANLAARLAATREALARAGVAEERYSMGNVELLTWLFALALCAGGLVLIAFGVWPQ